MGKVKNNGTKRVLILVWPKGNWIFQWRQGNLLIWCIVVIWNIYVVVFIISFN
jgi:hypothetical protein